MSKLFIEEVIYLSGTAKSASRFGGDYEQLPFFQFVFCDDELEGVQEELTIIEANILKELGSQLYDDLGIGAIRPYECSEREFNKRLEKLYEWSECLESYSPLVSELDDYIMGCEIEGKLSRGRGGAIISTLVK